MMLVCFLLSDFRKSYNLTIQDREQPLLLHRPKKRAEQPGVSALLQYLSVKQI